MESNGDSCKTLIRERYSLAKELRSQQLEYHRNKQKERKRYIIIKNQKEQIEISN